MFSNMIVLRIKNLCNERNISINRLAKISSVKQSTLNSIMHHYSSNPRILTLKKICDGLNISLEEFFNDNIFKKM